MVSQTSTSARFTCFVRILTFLAALISLTVPVGAQSVPQVAGMLDDGITHAPSATGYFDYNGFVPLVTQGANYADPVFGATVRRVTTDHSVDDIYARNMWWNADETKYLHRIENNGDYWEIIDVATGAVTHTGITGYGGMAANGGFDAADPNALYYYSGPSIHKVTLNASGTWSDSVYFTTPGNQTIGDLGGTINWMDASGRYMLVRYGSEPSVHLYDRQNLSAGPYANPISGGPYADTGSYLGLTPDGKFIVGYDSTPGMGVGMGAGVSWQIDHTNRSVAPAPNYYWDLCGDHGSFISASDGRNYRIGYDCYAQAGIWRIDITNSIGTPGAFMTEAQQQALPNNKRLLAFQTWNDFGHFATAAKGPLQDWGFTSTEDGSDTFNSGAADSSGNITPWHTYRQEIIGINVVTGEIRRLAHHRSRLGADYYDTPRVSVSWGGKWVGWSSNFDQSGIHDIYAVQFSMAADTISPTISITAPILGTIVSGATTVSANASDNVGVAGVQFKLDGVNLGAEVTVAPYAISWNTTLATNALHTLTATARDAAGNTATATTVAVTVSNSILDITPPVISAVVSANVSSTGATITWTTNEASDSQVDYGPTTSYGSSAALDTTKVTAHSQTLSGLAAGTLYHYRVKSRDAAGNLATSGDFTFTTATGSATPGFVGYWKFDDGSGVTAVDASGNGNSGTLFNGTAWTTGKFNGALSFDGVSGYVNVPHTAALDSYPLTVAAWIKTSATGLNGIVNKYYPGSMNGYQVFMNGGNLCAWYFKDAANYVWDGSGCTLMTPGYNDNQWHQVVLVVDAGGGRMYVDGVLKASQGWTGAPGATSSTQPLNIASYPATASPYLAGVLDDIRIYNYALSATEITNLYNAAATPTLENVAWINLVNVTATGNSLQKTAGCDGCEDAGATSQQQIASGDGYLEFTASEITALRYAGLSNGNPGTSAAEIKYAIRLQSDAEVNENGVYKASTTYMSGDLFRVSVESGVVKYYKNGVLFYTSTTAPSYPLLVDVAILNLNGTVTNAVISRVP